MKHGFLYSTFTFSLIIFILVSFSVSVLFAGNFYIAPTGNDSNDGSLDLPWATLAQ